MEKYLKDLFISLKTLETGAKFMGIIISIICFIIDLILRAHHIHVPNFLRGIYFSIGIFSLIFLSNDFFKSIRITREKLEKEKKFIENIKRFVDDEHSVLYKFAQTGWKNIILETEEMKKAANNIKELYGFIKIKDNKAFIDEHTLKLLEIAFGFRK